MYGIDGREDLPEEELPHLEGYMGSAPVRIAPTDPRWLSTSTHHRRAALCTAASGPHRIVRT